MRWLDYTCNFCLGNITVGGLNLWDKNLGGKGPMSLWSDRYSISKSWFKIRVS